MEPPQSDEGVTPVADTAEAPPPTPGASTRGDSTPGVSAPGVSTPGVSTPGVSTRASNMLAHISMRGNVPGHVAAWLGEPGSGLAIEAILLAPGASGPPHLSPAVESQLIYPAGLKTPWTAGGRPCGSAGFGLGCLGIRFRMSAETAAFFDCRYDIAFTDGERHENVPGSNIALSPSGAAVEAIRLHVTSRPPTSPLIVLSDVEDPPVPGEGAYDDDPTIQFRLLSPGFATHPPDIRNAALIPAGPWQAMAVSFNRRVFGPRPVTVRVVEEATVAGEGVVFDRDFNLVPGTNRLTPDDQVERYRTLARQGRGTGIRRITGMSLVCKTRAPGNYGHFLMDMFPKAWLATRLLGRRPINYIVHETDIVDLVREVFTRVGINPFAVSATDSMPVLCEAAIVIDGLTAHGTYQSPICAQALADLGATIPPAPYAKIFVSRHAEQRALLNQEAVETVLRDRGFAIIDPARMTLAEQISLFKGASTVVGPLGAALTNIAFCPRGSRIVALTAQSFPDTFFWFLSQHLGHDYREVRGLDISGKPDDPETWNAGFTLADEDLAFLATL